MAFLRIPEKIAEDFIGKSNTKKHHDAELQIKLLIRGALASDENSMDVLSGQILHGKLRNYLKAHKLEGPAWIDLDISTQMAWDDLAAEIKEADMALEREMIKALDAVNDAHEEKALAPGMECHCEFCERWREIEGIPVPKVV